MSDKELLYGAATNTQQVKFVFGQSTADSNKFAAAGNLKDGELVFVANVDGKGGAIYASGTLVSSRVLDYSITGNAGSEQTVAVTYLNSSNEVENVSCKVVDASYVESQISALEEAVDSSLAEIIESIEEVRDIAEGQSYTLHQITPTETNVKEEYQLFVGDNAVSDSSTIKIYKDSALKGAELQTIDGEDHLVLTYTTSSGDDTSVHINVADFLRESEFKSGLDVSNGQVSVKIDGASEGFLTVGAEGVKLSGVQDAIDEAAAESKTEIAAKTDGHVIVSSAEGANGQTVYTITESDIASATTLGQVSEKADANESAIATLNGDESTAGSVKNAVKVAQDALQANIDEKVDASVFEDAVDALKAADASNLESAEDYADGLKQTIDNYTVNGQKISTNPVLGASDIEYKAADGESEAVSVAGAISALETAIGQGGSVEAQIEAAIQGLDSSATGSGAFVDVEVVMTDGKVTSVSVSEDDIASAALLGKATDASTAETAFGKIAKAQATADSAQSDLDALEGVVGTKSTDSDLTSTTVWDALDEIADAAGADSSKIEAHLASDFVVAGEAQAVSVSGVAGADGYKDFTVALNIASDEKVLSQTADGLKSTISLVHDSSAQTIKLTGIDGAELASIDTTEFVVDGLLEDASYNQSTGELTLTFNDGKDPIVIDMVELMDIEDIVIANESADYLSSSVAADTSVATIGVKLGDFSDPQKNGLASTSAVKIYVDGLVSDANESVDDLSTKLANYITSNDESISEINSDISTLDASVLANAQAIDALEKSLTDTIDGLDASLTSTTDHITLNVVEENGVITAVNLSEDDIASAESLGELTALVGTLPTEGTDASTIVGYVDEKVAAVSDAISNLDSTVVADDDSFVSVTVSQADGKLSDSSIAVTYGSYKDGETAQVDGIAKVSDTETFVNKQVTSALTWNVL